MTARPAFDGPLPPLLKGELAPGSRSWMEGVALASWEPVWQLGEEGPHATVRAYPAGKLALFEGDRPTGVSIPIVAYVVRAGDLTLGVDSGLSARWRTPLGGDVAEDIPGGSQRYRPVLDGPSFADQLAAEGVTLDRALCTHLHLDHVGGARQLELPIEASATELALALAGAPGAYPADDLAGLQLAPIELDRGPLGPWDHHAVLAPGVLAIATPGHTGGSISVFVCLGAAWGLLCGDAPYPPADELGSDAYRGMLRIRRAVEDVGGTLVLAGHDTAALRACAGGAWLGA